MKEVIIDPDKITMRRLGRFRKDMADLKDIADPLESMERQCEIIAAMTDNWSVEDLLDLPTRHFKELSAALAAALNGQVPNESATN